MHIFIMFLQVKEIKELHVEPTNLCNAACPMCARTVFGGLTAQGRGFSSWTLDDAKLVFTGLPNLTRVFFCGTHGDPLITPEIVEIIAYVKSQGLIVDIFTNGSLRSINTWTKLLSVLTKDDSITFGVDGLETNHLYRQNTNIDVILKRMKLSATYPVQVHWDFLAFKHNEHEIESCKNLANDLGITRFRIRRTPRFDKIDPFPVIDQNGDITHYLEQPTDTKYKHPGTDKMKRSAGKSKYTIPEIIDRAKQLTDFEIIPGSPIPSVDIHCVYKKAKKLYVNSRLEIFPCCYISDTYETYKYLSEEELKYPIGELTLLTTTWEEILQSQFFNSLEESWTNNNVIPRCIKTCGITNREAEQNLQVDK